MITLREKLMLYTVEMYFRKNGVIYSPMGEYGFFRKYYYELILYLMKTKLYIGRLM